MKHLLFLLLFSSSFLFAQDTSRLDVGRLTLNQDLIISKTIESKDFRNLPIDNIDDIIKTFFLGNITTQPYFEPLYLVEGSIMNNISVYSLFDIESISLIENLGARVLFGNTQSRPIFLIKIKKEKRQGWSGNFSTQLSFKDYENRKPQSLFAFNNPFTSTQSLYSNFSKDSTRLEFNQQYYSSLNYSSDKITFKISGAFSKQKNPEFTSLSNSNLVNNRRRFTSSLPSISSPLANVLFSYSLNKNFDISLNSAYFQQEQDTQGNLSNFDYSQTSISKNTGKQYLFQNGVDIRYKSKIGFQNLLSLGYNKSAFDINIERFSQMTNYNSNNLYLEDAKLESLRLRNHLSYTKKTNLFSILTAIDLELAKNSYDQNTSTTNYFNNNLSSRGSDSATANFKSSYLTPYLEINYKNLLAFRNAWLFDFNKNNPSYKKNSPTPFIGLDFYPIKQKDLQILLNSSYFRNITLNNNPQLTGVSRGLITSPINLNYNFLVPFEKSESNLDYYQAAAKISYKKNSLTYNWSKFEYPTIDNILLPGFSEIVYIPNVLINSSVLQSINLESVIFENSNFKWNTTLNFNWYNSKIDADYIPQPNMVDDYKTGSFNNRLNYKNFNLGINMLYGFDFNYKTVSLSSPTRQIDIEEKIIRLENLYLAYNFKKGSHQLDTYLFSRNPFALHPTHQTIIKQYGVGLTYKY
ncbi:hypothetical protein [Pedobacter glucosidilyticus]|uniref:hypothetical protein n=1 Tax=Pedobacter glucosidilyticus TaxID=1122941 RepID=UPI0026F184B5|nr:hypothetical protein [Pedobacter glucosidilyticus]